MLIREETPDDIQAITDVTIAAFANHPISNQTEHYIVLALRNAGALSLSLVAEDAGRVLGHVAFSPITISDGATNWYGLGPVSVWPEMQRQGIGSCLIKHGLTMLKGRKAKGCSLVGEPDYYHRFGFRNYPELTHEGIPQQYFLCLPFTSEIPKGRVQYHEAFEATE